MARVLRTRNRPASATSGATVLLNPRSQDDRLNPRPQDDREATSARQAAEALFARKQEHHAPAREPEGPQTRQPRILAASPPTRPDAASTPGSSKAETHRAIPKSQVDRIRTWLRYGMTLDQVAAVCGVPATEIDRALRLAVIASAGGGLG